MNITNNKTPNNNFKVRASYYNYEKDKENELDYIGNSSSPINVNITADAGVADYLPCVAVEYSGNIYDSNENTTGGINICDDFSCSFRVNTTFVKNNGYNGCISFAWTNESLDEDMIPSDCQACNYNEAVRKIDDITYYNGLFDDSLMENGIKGFVVTLYPSTDEADYTGNLYTTKLDRYMISYKNKNNNLVHIANSFPNNQKIDLFDNDWNLLDIVISVKHTDGIYEFYINDMLLASIPNNDDEIDMEWGENEGYFTANMIASHYIEANLEIINIDNSFHLNQTEKRNLNNLGVSVLNYYDEERDEGDYTKAFQDALSENRRVYVPGGTYRITGELVVRDNCELELAQDAVLEFDPIYTWEETDEVSGETTTVTIEPADFRCITLNMLSSLVGNHATIRVPYAFEGKVIYASTRSHSDSDSINSVLPFDSWDPQWKPARYLKDINIVKPIEIGHEITYRKSQSEIDELKKKDDYNSDVDDYITDNVDGIHAAVNNVCKGIAVFIEGYRSGEGGSTFIWGLDYSGLRIAGAFEYGIKCTNNYIWVDSNGTYIPNPPEDKTGLKKKWAWNHDMRLSAFIDGCKTSVFMDHCNNAYISAIIQPRPAYIEKGQDDFSPYALNGVYLDNCINVNLSGTRVWDWNATNTKWAPGNENQHIRLDDDCHGLILDDFLYYEMSSYNIRDLIYTLTPKNYDNMTILQEPVAKFISLDTDNTKSSLFVDKRIDIENNPGEMITTYGMTTTDMICCGNLTENGTDNGTINIVPADDGGEDDGGTNSENLTEITVNGFAFSKESNSTIAFYDENHSHIANASISDLIEDVMPVDDGTQEGSDPESSIEYSVQSDGSSKITIKNTIDPKYFRISCKTDIIGDEPSITVNDNTTTFKTNYLKDNVYIKQQYVEGLQEMLDKLEDRIYKLENLNEPDTEQ